MEKQKLQFIFPANINYSSLVRHIAKEVCKMAKFDDVWRDRLELVVDELFMNSVDYGSTKGKSFICINFEYDEKELKFSIEDDGTGEKAVSAKELSKIILKNQSNTDLSKTSGRGLSMIAQSWTDGVEIDDGNRGGVRISFVKEIPDEEVVEDQENKPTPDPDNTVEENVIKLTGEIDQSNIKEKTAPVYTKVSEMPEGGTLMLDFDDVNYINSMFMVSLAAWHTSMKKKKGKICLKNIKGRVKEVLDMTGLSKVLNIQS